MALNVPLFKIYWDDRDVSMVTETIKKGMNWATGPNVQEFESLLASYVGVNHGVTFSSGTSALHALMLACGIGPGDEVIVPAFTFIATANAALFVGAKPVFAEIEGETCGLDPKDVERKITSRTRAIMPVHIGGCSCRIEELREIADRHKLLLIEDAAESLGARVNDRKVGSFGDAAMFSFCAPKVITTGEGGAVVTRSKEIYEKLKLIRSHGRAETKDYFSTSESLEYITLGYNFRMSNITAALGISQMSKLEEIIRLRRDRAKKMERALSSITGILLPSTPGNFFHIYQMYTIKVKGGKEQRDSLMKHLNDMGISTKIYFDPIHLTQFYRKTFGCKTGDLPSTEKISQQVLTLPMYPSLTPQEIEYVARGVAKFFEDKKPRM